MRILHFLPVYVPAWQFGGPILSVSRLCEGLVEQGVDVRVITTNAGLGNFPRDQLGVPQTVNGVQVFYYPVDQVRGAIRSKALVDSLPHHMDWAHLLHLSSIWQPLGIPVQKVAHSAGVPVIQTLRGALGPYSWRRGWWKKVPYFFLKERPLLQSASAMHCTTMQEAREINWLGLKPPVELLPNPIEFSHLHYNPRLGDSWRERMGFSLSEPLLLVAGRLHHKKGLELLPQVLYGLSRRPWQLLVVGKDQDGTRSRLQSKLSRLGLGNRCHWFDQLPAHELSAPYNAADCLLLPSRHENFGNVVVEALACGCGVIISDRVGIAEAISQCPGVRVCSRSPERWTAALDDVLATNRPGTHSAEWVVRYFSKQIVTSQAMHIYSSILAHE